MLVICKVYVKGAAEAADGSGERGEKAPWGFLGAFSAGSGRQRRGGVRGDDGFMCRAAEGGARGGEGGGGKDCGPCKNRVNTTGAAVLAREMFKGFPSLFR
jgi:hypothetical protein